MKLKIKPRRDKGLGIVLVVNKGVGNESLLCASMQCSFITREKGFRSFVTLGNYNKRTDCYT